MAGIAAAVLAAGRTAGAPARRRAADGAAQARSPRTGDTRFGIEHGFADIRTTAQISASGCRCRTTRRCAPTSTNSGRTGAPALTAEAAALLRADERHHRRAQVHSDHAVDARRSTATSRRSSPTCSIARAPRRSRARRSGIMGAAVEGHLDSGHVVGSVSGHLYQSLPRRRPVAVRRPARGVERSPTTI